MIVVREQRTEHTVYKTGCEDLVIARTTLSLEKTARVSADGGIFLLILYCERHEVNPLVCLLGRTYGSKEHSVAHAHFHRAISLLCKFARLYRNLTAIAKLNGLLYWL